MATMRDTSFVRPDVARPTPTWNQCACRRQHPTTRAFIECLMPGALVEGDGSFALIATCTVPAVSLSRSFHEAMAGKHALDAHGCGEGCRGEHQVVRVALG
jgi:hypothetical protein